MKRALWIALAAAVSAACSHEPAGPRPYVLSSPHRSVAAFPFDYGDGAKNGAPAAYGAFQARLRGDGFLLANAGKTLNVYNASALKKAGAFNQLADAAVLARALGAKAALVGSADDAFDRVDRIAATYGRDPRGRSILLRPAIATRRAGLSLRLRLIDAQTAAVLWSGAYSGQLVGVPLSSVADQVADVLNQDLLEAMEKGQF